MMSDQAVESGARALLAILARQPRAVITIPAADPSWASQPEASRQLLRDVTREVLESAAKEPSP